MQHLLHKKEKEEKYGNRRVILIIKTAELFE